MKSITRCSWCGEDPLYIEYHDTEWGLPLRDEQKLFEFLILETFQSGLSWITILRKRENFRKALDNFDYNKIALYDEEKITELLQDAGIIRNKLKIRATISNAVAFLEIQNEFGSFSKYVWGFINNIPIQNNSKSMSEVKATSVTSDKLSKELKNRGFKFIGSTVIYAYMQATSMVNDHSIYCFRHQEVQIT
jgi:DNA-3-methyladenine glycosylase I